MIGSAHLTSISRIARVSVGLAALGLVVTGCGNLPGYGESAGSTNAAARSSSDSGVTISAASTSLGKILVGEDDRTVYMWKMDEGTQSACEDACATAWPPVTTDGAPEAASGAKASLLGTTHRSDGSLQVTYDGHPLYYFAKDEESGDVKGQGSKGFGAAWWVMSGTGKVITSTAKAEPAASNDDSDASEPLGTPAKKATPKKTATKKATPKPAATKSESGDGSGYSYDYGDY